MRSFKSLNEPDRSELYSSITLFACFCAFPGVWFICAGRWFQALGEAIEKIGDMLYGLGWRVLDERPATTEAEE